MKRYFGITILILASVAVILFTGYNSPSLPHGFNGESDQGKTLDHLTDSILTAQANENRPHLSAPISNWQDRVSKKPFGIFVAPQNSPIVPEHFYGYHTGVDFETTEQEQNGDVPVFAICSGPLLQKKTATGYGGVAVQRCTLKDQPVTVVYGHLKVESIKSGINKQLKAGQQIGILGKGFSEETDGARKHLHLGVHEGAMPNILGYVDTRSQLDNWIDVTEFLVKSNE